MQNITSRKELRNAILQLEEKQALQGQLLKDQFNRAVDDFRALGWIKSAAKVAAIPGAIDKVLGTTLSLAAWAISKRLLVGKSGSASRKVFGTLLQYGMMYVVIKYPEIIKSTGLGLLHKVFGKRGSEE
jgi:mevalonate pyrophosphate decarboxylase